MSKNESRQERKQQENKNESSSSGISKVYYWIIGILFIVLIGLVFFIFSQSGDDVNIEDDSASDSEMVEESPNGTNETESGTETEEDTSTDDTTDESDQTGVSDETTDETEDTAGTEDTEEDTTEEDTSTDEDDTTDEDTSEDDSTAVNEDAPLNESYAVDYSEGSADRIAIREQVMQTTGLGNDLIEWWVGNNGPGRVVATVSNGEQTEHYEVYLQYGDGSWHVTSYEQLAENPGN